MTEIVLPCDPAIAAAWTEAERSAYLTTLTRPDKPLPKDVVRFFVRPVGWAERRRLREEAPTWWLTRRGEELRQSEVALIRNGGDRQAFHDSLSVEDRRALREYNLFQEAMIIATVRTCVKEVREDGETYTIDDYLQQDLIGDIALYQLDELIMRVGQLTGSMGKS